MAKTPAQRSKEYNDRLRKSPLERLTFEQAKQVRPLRKPVEVQCAQCSRWYGSSPKYLRLKEKPLCLSCINRNRSSEVKAKIGKSVSKAFSTPEQRKRISETSKKLHKEGVLKPPVVDAVTRSNATKKSWKSPEYKEKQSKAREQYDTPEYREQIRKSNEQTWQSNQLRQANSKHTKQMWEQGQLNPPPKKVKTQKEMSKLAWDRRDKARQKYHSDIDTNRKVSRKRYFGNSHNEIIRSHSKRDKLRSKVSNWFGNQCHDCSCDDPWTWQLHHINGGGGKQRSESGNDLWQIASNRGKKWATSELEMLCANCHTKKHKPMIGLSKSATSKRNKRERLIDVLGSVCAHCGTIDKEVFQIDHITGYDGVSPRLNNIDEVQVLCANCNFSKGNKALRIKSVISSYLSKRGKESSRLWLALREEFTPEEIGCGLTLYFREADRIGNSMLSCQNILRLFVEDGQIAIPPDQWASIKRKFNKGIIIESVADIIPMLDLPITTLSQEARNLELNKLRRVKTKHSDKLSQSIAGQSLSAHYFDKHRFNSVGATHSATEIWGNHDLRVKLARGLFVWGAHEGITNRNFRRYLTSVMRIPGQFRPAVALELIRKFGATSFYDPCGGWGDRLLGAMAGDCSDILINDVNKDVCASYRKMFDSHKGSHQTLIISNLDALQVKLNYKQYDLAFTSPPYYNTEVYERNNPLQHHNHYSFDEWIDKFLLPLLISMRTYAATAAINVPRSYLDYLPKPDLLLDYPIRRMKAGISSEIVCIYL